VKITEGKATYRTITIELETREEALLVSHLVNNAPGIPLVDYCEQRGVDEEKLFTLTHEIYAELDDLGINTCCTKDC